VDGFQLPIDAFGEVVPHDHPDLVGEARMLRGVASNHIVPDNNYGCQRLSSALFKNKPNRQGYLSVGSQPCIEACDQAPVDYMDGRGWLGVVSISVESFRSFDPATQAADRWKIGMYPLPNDDPPDPCHGAVWGTITKAKADDIRRVVEWLIEIPDVVLDETAMPRLG
jgi:hypothetical protein